MTYTTPTIKSLQPRLAAVARIKRGRSGEEQERLSGYTCNGFLEGVKLRIELARTK